MNLMRKTFSVLSLIISSALLLFIFYKSEFIFEGTNRDHYLKYYLLCFTLIVFSVVSFFIKKTLKDYLIIITFSIISSVYIFEIFLVHLDSKKKDLRIKKTETYKKKTSLDWDERSQLQVYRDLLDVNPTAVPYYYPSEIDINGKKIHTLSGISNSLTVFCNENGYFSINESDRYGFNNPDQDWDAKDIEYVFVGDSFTHGYCVNRPNDIPSFFRQISKKAVLNLGYGRNGPLIEYATLREYMPKNTKKIIFMYYGGNDLSDLNTEIKNKILYKYISDENFNQNLINIQKEIDTVKRKNISIISKISKNNKYNTLKLIKLRKLIKQKIKKSKIFKENQSYQFEEFKNILSLTKKLSITNESELFFIYLHAERYSNENKALTDDEKYSQKIKSIIEDLNINFLDIHQELFKKEKDPLKYFPFQGGGHYSEEGYRKVAETIFKFTNR